MKQNALSQEFKTGSLIKFALPTIGMLAFMSLYSVIDGIFVARLISEDALSAVNIILPFLNIIFAIGLMLSIGSNAIIAKYLGEKNEKAARNFFTLIYIVGIGISLVICAISLIFSDEFLKLLGSTPRLDVYTKDYLISLTVFIPFIFLQLFAQSFFVTAGQPKLGLLSTFAGGIANIILDYIFIAVFNMGIAGAGIATGIGFAIPGLFGLLYFTFSKKSPLRFVRPQWNSKNLRHALFNGSSEFVTNISVGITTFLFNVTMIRYAGESGVAAISTILYVQMIQMAVYLGYSYGVAPIISFKYGEGNTEQLKQIMNVSFKFISIISIIVILFSILGADLAVGIFISPESETYPLAKHGFRLFSLSYLFMGLNIFISSMFTALGNGKISAFLSAMRTLVFLVTLLTLLPLLIGIDGVWLATPIAEGLALILSLYYYRKYKTRYMGKTKGQL